MCPSIACYCLSDATELCIVRTEMFPWESFYGNDQIMRTVKLYYALYLNTNMTCNETNIN